MHLASPFCLLTQPLWKAESWVSASSPPWSTLLFLKRYAVKLWSLVDFFFYLNPDRFFSSIFYLSKDLDLSFYKGQNEREQYKRGFPDSSSGKESACNTGDLGLIPGSGISAGGVNGNAFQYSCLENLMDRGTWQIPVHRVTKSRTWLSTLAGQRRQRGYIAGSPYTSYSILGCWGYKLKTKQTNKKPQ